MGLSSKWKFGSGKHLTPSISNKRDAKSTSSSTLSVKPAPTYHSNTSKKNLTVTRSQHKTSYNPPTNNTSSNNNNSSNNSNNNNNTTRTKSAPSPISWIRSSLRSSASKRKSIISRDDPAFARLHKPFTQQNLEHQKLLSAFEWHFNEGSNNASAPKSRNGGAAANDSQQAGRRLSFISSLSPCASRRTSLECAHGPKGEVVLELDGRRLDNKAPPSPVSDAPASSGGKSGKSSPTRFWPANGLFERYTM